MARSKCIFCSILAGDAPAHVVFDDDVALAFLDITPLFKGHTLVIPRDHHVTLTDLPADLVGDYFARVRHLAGVIETELNAAGTFVAMNNTVSHSVPHLHTHVVPRNPKDGLRGFFWPRTKYESDTEAARVAARLRKACIFDPPRPPA